MSSLSAKDRVSLCSFTFSDGRRCRTPRFANHPRFCPYHAQKEARARAAQSLGKDLARYFSGNYLSACDLSTALACLIPAVIRGDVKPKTAHTVAYLVQTLMQTIHISQHEYINAFGTDGWRKSIRNSVNGNHDYRFPPAPEPGPAPDQPEPPQPHPQPAQSQPQAQQSAPASQPAPPPHTPLPPTSAEFVQRVVAGLQTGEGQTPQASPATQPSTAQTPSPTPTLAPATQSAPSAAPTPQPDTPPTVTHTPQPGPNRDAPWLHFGDTRRIRPDSKLL
jgi:hypothetical protein